MNRTALLEQPAAEHRIPAEPSTRDCWFWAGWEPDRFYKRIGARSTLYFGNGDWIADWRARLESAACLQAVREAGGTILVTRFYKGFGPSVERADWKSLKRFVARAHDHDLKVWGYLQGQSIFGEFLFHEYPEAKDWIAHAFDGSLRTWGGAYNRFAPCLTSEGYREMLESLIEEGVQEIGLDGFHIDNSYYAHCYCPRCKTLFRQWLEERGDLEQVTGIEKADFVEPPPLGKEADIIPDPLAILWIEFGVQQRMRFLRAIRHKIRQIDPGISLAGNPAFLRSFASRLSHGFDPALEHAAFDSVCIENGNRPRYSHGVLFSQADKHLMAEAGMLRTWVTSWAPSRTSQKPGYEAPLGAQSIWAGLAEEFSFQNANWGNNWALRPTGDGDIFLKDSLAVQWAEFTSALQYFRRLENELGGQPRRQWGEIVVYVDTRMLSLCPMSDCRVLQAFLGQLLLRSVPFKIVYQEQSLPENTHTILICGQRGLKTSEMDRLAASADGRNCQIWLLGECGKFDEWLVPRGAANLRKLHGRPSVRSIALPMTQFLRSDSGSRKYFQGEAPTFTPDSLKELEPVFAELGERQGIQVHAPNGVLANVESLGDSKILIHLRDLREDKSAVGDAEVVIAIKGRVPCLEGFSKNWKSPAILAGHADGSRRAFSLPAFQHYACFTFLRSDFGNCAPAIPDDPDGRKGGGSIYAN